MRALALFLLLLPASAGAQDFNAVDLYRLCQTNQPACGDFIRTSLKRAGWAEQVPFGYMLDRGKLEWLVCPAGDPRNSFLAKEYVKFWRERTDELAQASAVRAVIKAFSESDPTHDCAANKNT